MYKCPPHIQGLYLDIRCPPKASVGKNGRRSKSALMCFGLLPHCPFLVGQLTSWRLSSSRCAQRWVSPPPQAHVKAQKASKEQQLDMMNKHCQHLESRLDDMLSRIAKETEEIQDLEQQLTDGRTASFSPETRESSALLPGTQSLPVAAAQQF